MAWLSPWTWLAALSVALPIAIHLLARDRSRRQPFPTLRFLEPTRLSAVSRRKLQDLPLLAVRIAIVLAAVAALAGPIIVTPARQAVWASHVARAVVLDDRRAPPDDELRSAAVGATFARARVADAVADAVRWIAEQTQARREIVVLSAFRRGAVDEADFAAVPDGIGIRLVRTGEPTVSRDREITRLVLRGDRLVRVTERLTLSAEQTDAREVAAQTLVDVPIAVTASPADRAAADAGLRAVLRRGVLLPPAGLLQPIEVAWPGDVTALAAIIESRLEAPLDTWEPEHLSDEDLEALARPVDSSGPGTPVDEGDRKAMWGLVLILLGLETWMRRGTAWT